MPRIPLTQGSYTTRSVIASAQRNVNLYAEKNPPDAKAPFTFYPAPGLTTLAVPPSFGPARGLYLANSGDLYYAAGSALYYVSPTWQLTRLGGLLSSSGIVSMADNGTTMVVVDNTSSGYQVDLTTRAFSAISAADNSPPPLGGGVYAFYGATRTDVIDGYLLFNQPGTRFFYSTYLNEVEFDATYIAAKNGYSDNLVTIIVTLRQIWLIGEKTTEIWFDAGGTNFPFQIIPGPFIQHGCLAKWSVAQVDGRVFWLSQDQAGNNILVRGHGYQAEAITTQAIVDEWAQYPTTADAVGFCFQQDGHIFYQINFPTADRSWRWDETVRRSASTPMASTLLATGKTAHSTTSTRPLTPTPASRCSSGADFRT